MYRFKPAVFLFFSVIFFAGISGAEAAGVSPRASELTRVFGLPITNSMVTSWVVSILLIVLIRLAIKKPKLVPTRSQAVVESVVEGIMGIITPIVGSKMVRITFPLLIGLFLFILIQNWSGLFPGVGTIGWGPVVEEGRFVVERYWIRPGNADLNMTLALALVSWFAWLYFIFRYAGPRLVGYDIFGNKANKREVPAAIYYVLFPIFFAVGLIEIISIVFRPVALSFRLFGNVFGGENLLHSMFALFPWGLPVPFYLLEVLIGLIQALVFTLLVAVYIGLICNHEVAEGESGGHH